MKKVSLEEAINIVDSKLGRCQKYLEMCLKDKGAAACWRQGEIYTLCQDCPPKVVKPGKKEKVYKHFNSEPLPKEISCEEQILKKCLKDLNVGVEGVGRFEIGSIRGAVRNPASLNISQQVPDFTLGAHISARGYNFEIKPQ